MKTLKYDQSALTIMNLFESMTGALLKDCIVGPELLTFIVEENEIGKAIGRQGMNVRKLEHALNKKVRMVAFNPEIARFVQNLIRPLEAEDIIMENGILTISGGDTQTKGLLIGRDRRNINNLKDIVSRYFEIEEVKVV
ncbi:NusA-like transcription termination signal-binding factor [Candidatus Woesearchaeota archaeon]|nr:NusA-like transcription termination signal-binding factor [Candidatus Woesearchaeota archaeon]